MIIILLIILFIIIVWFGFDRIQEETILTMEQAKTIAENSDCLSEGNLTDDYMYNANSKTWWFDLDVERPECKPACVVWEDTGEAEINWRCTGLIPE